MTRRTATISIIYGTQFMMIHDQLIRFDRPGAERGEDDKQVALGTGSGHQRPHGRQEAARPLSGLQAHEGATGILSCAAMPLRARFSVFCSCLARLQQSVVLASHGGLEPKQRAEYSGPRRALSLLLFKYKG